jgi:hypothetical protein
VAANREAAKLLISAADHVPILFTQIRHQDGARCHTNCNSGAIYVGESIKRSRFVFSSFPFEELGYLACRYFSINVKTINLTDRWLDCLLERSHFARQLPSRDIADKHICDRSNFRNNDPVFERAKLCRAFNGFVSPTCLYIFLVTYMKQVINVSHYDNYNDICKILMISRRNNAVFLNVTS